MYAKRRALTLPRLVGGADDAGLFDDEADDEAMAAPLLARGRDEPWSWRGRNRRDLGSRRSWQ
jgi:hypothetical protein